MSADLDAVDLKILAHLLKDGRAPAQQVADSVAAARSRARMTTRACSAARAKLPASTASRTPGIVFTA